MSLEQSNRFEDLRAVVDEEIETAGMLKRMDFLDIEADDRLRRIGFKKELQRLIGLYGPKITALIWRGQI